MLRGQIWAQLRPGWGVREMEREKAAFHAISIYFYEKCSFVSPLYLYERYFFQELTGFGVNFGFWVRYVDWYRRLQFFSLEIQRCCFFTASHIPQQRKPCAEVRQPQADCLASGRGLILAGSQEEFNSFKYDLIWLDHSLWPPTIFNQHQSTHGTPRSTFFSGWVTSCNKSPQRIGWMAAVQFGVLWSLPARWISLDVQCFTVSIAGSTSR